MNHRKKLYLYIVMLLSSSIVLYPFCNKIVNQVIETFCDDFDNPDDTQAKVICKFINCNIISNDDVINVIDDNSTVVSILGIDRSKDSNDTYIYLPKGEYQIYSSLGFDESITIDDVDDTYELICDYENHSVEIKKIVDNDIDDHKISIIDKEEKDNYISSDLDFHENNIESHNLDYSNITEDGFIPQGYVIIDGTYPSILISSYSKTDNSRIYIYSRNGGNYLGYISLNNNDHVGGITYDPVNDVLFVTGSNELINTYDYSTLMRTLENGKKVIDNPIAIDLKLNSNNNPVILSNDLNVLQSAATICYYDGYLYSIDYGLNSIIVKTSYDVINNSVVSVDNEVIIPEGAKCVQGMAFYQNGNTLYLVLASSSGFLKSKLSLYKADDSYEWEYINEKIIEVSKKIEGISIDKYGNISSIYEGKTTNSKLIGNINEIISNQTKTDTLNNMAYNVSGLVWDVLHSDDLSLNKAKKLIKKQKN